MASIVFCGAAQEVTGSMHLLEIGERRICLDCGLFQGRREEAKRKNIEFLRSPKEIDAVILSHAHIDHSGRLPKLAAEGFSGPIFATHAARDLCAVMLADSAHIQEEDANYLNKRLRAKNEPEVKPLYTTNDAVAAVQLMQSISYDRWFDVVPGVRATFFEAGHMLGSAGVKIQYRETDAQARTLVFTGDVGRPNVPILRDPAPLPACDYLISESTYGGRTSPPIDDMQGQLAEVVQGVLNKRGKLIIPAFSVGRTQTIVYQLAGLLREGKVKPIPVYIDSPLAVDASEVFKLHPECYDHDAAEFQRENGDILGGNLCTYIRTVEESKRIDQERRSSIIVSASGMCETGRVLHHLRHTVDDERNTIAIVGFQAEHTLGRRIEERTEVVRIFGEQHHLRAEVRVMHGFSGHADAHELRRHLAPVASGCRHALLVHGEMDQATALRDTLRLDGFQQVSIPARGERVVLD
ncbi:MAG TPA: MBL fold metallo-hydrolase [Phycisphaerae bacterium]